MRHLKLNITTKSNLFIGGTPTTFEIGGIDQYTVTDYEGNPYIPGSSLKGTLRQIVRELAVEQAEHTKKINQLYTAYLDKVEQEIATKPLPYNEAESKEKRQAMQRQIEKARAVNAAEYLFGMEGFNQTPKLLFSDFTLVDKIQPNLFSIDSKNSITAIKSSPKELVATPRTYQTVRPGVTFTGTILFQYVNHFEDEIMEAQFVEAAQALLAECFRLLTQGYYRLGNSGSRGYGWVEVCQEADK